MSLLDDVSYHRILMEFKRWHIWLANLRCHRRAAVSQFRQWSSSPSLPKCFSQKDINVSRNLPSLLLYHANSLEGTRRKIDIPYQ